MKFVNGIPVLEVCSECLQEYTRLGGFKEFGVTKGKKGAICEHCGREVKT